MARIIFVALLVLVAACAVMASIPVPKECGNNEEWTWCGNACIEPKCGKGHPPVRCDTACQQRCECVKGCCRNKGGQCVPTKNCGKND